MLITGIYFAILYVVAQILYGLLAASEKAVVAIRPFRLKELSSKGVKRAELLKTIRSNPDRFFLMIKSCQVILIALISLTSVTIFSPLAVVLGYIFQNTDYWIHVIIVFPFFLALFNVPVFIFSSKFFSNLISESKQEAFAISMSLPLYSLLVVFKPLLIIMNWLVKNVLFVFGVTRKSKIKNSLSESEIRMILRDGYIDSSINPYEKKIIYSMLEFSDTDVRRAMTPRTDIIAFEINDSIDDILKHATEENFSRFPVYEESIDNIKGIIHSRDLLYVFTHKELFAFKDIIREAYFVPDSKPIVELLREMQLNKTHMAIVLDEFGGTGGIITLEDILEEIVGDIQDEYDQEISKIVFITPNKARVLASMPIDEFADEFNVEVGEGEFDTIGGMLVTVMGKIPGRGEIYNFDGFSLEVREKEGHRIDTLIARKTPAEENK